MQFAAFDVCDPAAVVDAVDSFESDIGPIDVLVNNAGFQNRGAVLEYDVDDFRRIIEVNLVSAFTVAKAVAGHMVGRGRGKIVNVCSVMSEVGPTDRRCIQRDQGWIENADPRMCADFGPLGIQVNGLGPGYFATEFTAALVADQSSPNGWPANTRRPLGTRRRARRSHRVPRQRRVQLRQRPHLYVDGGMTAVV